MRAQRFRVVSVPVWLVVATGHTRGQEPMTVRQASPVGDMLDTVTRLRTYGYANVETARIGNHELWREPFG